MHHYSPWLRSAIALASLTAWLPSHAAPAMRVVFSAKLAGTPASVPVGSPLTWALMVAVLGIAATLVLRSRKTGSPWIAAILAASVLALGVGVTPFASPARAVANYSGSISRDASIMSNFYLSSFSRTPDLPSLSYWALMLTNLPAEPDLVVQNDDPSLVFEIVSADFIPDPVGAPEITYTMTLVPSMRAPSCTAGTSLSPGGGSCALHFLTLLN